MKLDLDKDIDALLRRHARRGTALPGRVDWSPQSEENGATAAMAEASSGLKHLDTDELSAYAENALPGPTRARYAAHLAACDECRRIATSITLAADVAGELERRERLALPAMTAAAPTQSWRGRLSALFAPGAWRYAVPLVVALVLVSGAVWLAILKPQSPAGEVAVRNSVPARSAAVLEKEAHLAPESEAAAPTDAATTGTNKSGAPLVTDRKESPPVAAAAGGEVARNREADQPDATNKIATVGPRPTAADSSVADGATAARTAAPPPPPAASTPRAQSEEVAVVVREPEAARSANTQELSRGDESYNRGYDNTQRSGGKDNSLNDTQSAGQSRGMVTRDQSDDRAKSEESAASPSISERSARRRTAPPPSRAPKEMLAKKEKTPAKSVPEAKRKEREAEAEETRTIAGRRFRRQGGGAWVDTAYQPAQATVNVRRGSEQFRALVADTPELRSIANAFSGEVIVVWQGRAYRIR